MLIFQLNTPSTIHFPSTQADLGVLAGDICKQSSDIGLPLVAVGFMYPQGYFRQHISADGWQEEVYTQLDFSEAPISPCAWPQGCGPLIAVPLADRQIYLQVWQVRVGRVNLYLLDTNISDNRQKTGDFQQDFTRLTKRRGCGNLSC